jgi:hypothetical protein
MAWLSLVIVLLIFFVPGSGVAVRIATQNLTASISWGGLSVAVPIPGTGPLRLFLVSFAAWLIIWLVLYLPDHWLAQRALRGHRSHRDFLARIGLWNDLVNSFRRFVSGRLAVGLAKFVFWGWIAKLVIAYLLQLSLDKLLPLIGSWLAVQFGNKIVPLLQSILNQWVKGLNGFGVNVNGLVLFVFATLVLIVSRAYALEQRDRLDYSSQQHHSELMKS